MPEKNILADYPSLTQLSAALQKGELTSADLARACHTNLKQYQEECNMFISTTAEEELLAQAEQASKSIKDQGAKASPLAGIPYALKDVFCAKDTKTSCGSKMLDNFIAPYDATAVAKLKQAQALLLGKTNLDEFAMGSSTEKSNYGAAKNPWDTARVAGGSSGGSAVAVACRIVPYALGTDTGGSVRQPAAFCGVTGLKPTYGRVSRYGMVAYASSLDQAGVFTLNAEDAAHVLQAISGHDDKDSTSSPSEVPNYAEQVKKAKGKDSLKGIKFGVPREFVGKDLDAKIKKVLDENLAVLQKAGAEVVEISLPNLEYAIPCYYTISLAEASANLARYDGVRYGHRSQDAKDIHDLYVNSRSEGFGAEVKKRILLGTYVLTTGYYDAYYLKAQQVRRLIRDDFVRAFTEVDMIVGPVTPTPAFKLGEKSDPVSMYLQDIYTVSANLAGLPAMSLPMGFVDDLPVGMQLIGKHFGEGEMLANAAVFQDLTDWHQKTPALLQREGQKKRA